MHEKVSGILKGTLIILKPLNAILFDVLEILSGRQSLFSS